VEAAGDEINREMTVKQAAFHGCAFASVDVQLTTKSRRKRP
jgi:hypothetical protein